MGNAWLMSYLTQTVSSQYPVIRLGIAWEMPGKMPGIFPVVKADSKKTKISRGKKVKLYPPILLEVTRYTNGASVYYKQKSLHA